MKPLYFATSNKWKFSQAKNYFRKKGIELKQFKIDLPESRSEDGLVIAKEKADYTFKKLKKPFFVLDGSFQIKALNDFPKSYVKLADKYLGAEGILKLLQGKKNRNWEFFNILCYKDARVEKLFVEIQKGKVVGKLSHNKMGPVRDFDRVLIPEGYQKTFAEMNKKELADYDNNVWRPMVFDRFIRWYKNHSKIRSAV